MRRAWIIWGLLLFAFTWVTWDQAVFQPLIARLETLASRPEAQRAFTDPTQGRVDALILLLTVLVLAPAAALIALLVLVFAFIWVSLLLEPVFRALKFPAWSAVPIVLLGTGYGLHRLQWLWLQQSVHVLSLVARAWIVYFSTPVTAPH